MSNGDPINKSREYVDYKAGEEIFAEGSTGEEIYVILNGKVEVSQRVGWKNEAIAILEDGDFFGEMGPITKTPRSATTTALTDTSLEKLSLAELLWDMHNDQKIMEDVFSRMAKRLRDTTSLLNVEIARSRSTEVDNRGPKISYLRGKMEEKDEEIERLKRQIDSPKSYRPTPWYLSLRIVELVMLLAILALILLRN